MTEETTSRAFARRVKERRHELGWSARRLAEECGRVGYLISESVLANMDAGRRESVPVDEVAVFAEALGVTPDWLMYGDIPAGRIGLAVNSALAADYRSAIRRVLSEYDPDSDTHSANMVEAFALGMSQLMLRLANDVQIEVLGAPYRKPEAPPTGEDTKQTKPEKTMRKGPGRGTRR